MRQKTGNLAASVKQRLLNLATASGEDFNLMQVRYAIERLLYRMSRSRHAGAFLLKGAMLFALWEKHPHRPTRDMDLLFLTAQDRLELAAIFREVATLEVTPDGLNFDADSVQSDEIREDNAYGGIRVKMLASLGTARIPVQIDIGLGDAVHPEPQWTDFATLLDFPAPRIRPYPVYSVVAEKFHAMAELGIQNTRMKDYFDILYLQRHFEFAGADLQEAMRKTFQRRRPALSPDLPDALGKPFWESTLKQTQWTAFLRKNNLRVEADLEKVCSEIATFILPAIQPNPLMLHWTPKTGWHAQPKQT